MAFTMAFRREDHSPVLHAPMRDVSRPDTSAGPTLLHALGAMSSIRRALMFMPVAQVLSRLTRSGSADRFTRAAADCMRPQAVRDALRRGVSWADTSTLLT